MKYYMELQEYMEQKNKFKLAFSITESKYIIEK